MKTYYFIYTIEKNHRPGMYASEFKVKNDNEFWEKFIEWRRDGNINDQNPYDIKLVSLRVV